jgi:hypothetical protein
MLVRYAERDGSYRDRSADLMLSGALAFRLNSIRLRYPIVECLRLAL